MENSKSRAYSNWIFGKSGLKPIHTLYLTLAAMLNISCLGEDASDQLSDNSFGLQISIVGSSSQIGAPDTLFEDPAMVQVTDGSGAGVEGISVSFTQANGSPVFITNSGVTSNENVTQVLEPSIQACTAPLLSLINWERCKPVSTAPIPV